MTIRYTGFCLTIFLFAAGARAADQIDFAHQVAPILKKHCVECHGDDESKGGFSLNTRDLLLDAGAATAGDAASSRLIELVASRDKEDQMPPQDRARLTGKEVATLRHWIDQGLPWEAGFTFAKNRYEPPLRPRRPSLPPAVEGRGHPVDRLVDASFSRNDIVRPPRASDEAFIRRAYLDIIGLPPTPDELSAFLNDNRSDNRQRLVRSLLDRNIDYAEHWLTFWNDLLRNDYAGTGFITGGRKQITSWLYESLVTNKPYDRFVRELISPTEASDGFIRGIRWRGVVNASQSQPIQFAQNITQAFLGINMKCASCHDSFIDRWKLEETYGLAQVYATEPLTLHRCDKPLDRVVKAAWIFPELGQVDAGAPQPKRLDQLSHLMTHPENGRFTRTIVNRLWHRLLGRGIVHPVDAMHTEPFDADLLDYLAVHLADSGYDLKQTIELICTSEIYGAVMPVREIQQGGKFVFRGPAPRRMTAEQFLDAIWQITGAAPLRHDAPVTRFDFADESSAKARQPLSAKWIWAPPAKPDAAPPAGQTITFRKQFDLKAIPPRAVAAVTCDNEYRLFLNGSLIAEDKNWETVEIVPLQRHLKPGANELLVVAKNAGSGPNPAALFFEARILSGEGETGQVVATDEQWQWTSRTPNQRGKFKQPPKDFQPAHSFDSPTVWGRRVGSEAVAQLNAASGAPLKMVRASLLKSDFLMRALGRPNRDQIVTSRPNELTTLEAIDLANGASLADAVQRGAESRLAEHDSPASLIDWLFASALSRPPTEEELGLGKELLTSQPSQERVADLMWAVFMLPEFQLIR